MAGDDETSDLISVEVPLVFFNSLETEIYVRMAMECVQIFG